jgi:hypothetical protein
MKDVQRRLKILLLGLAAFYCGFVGAYKGSHYSTDFIPVYTGARCFVSGCNPYDTAQLQAQYFSHGGPVKLPPRWHREPPVYPPSTFLVVSPLALVSFPTARTIWAILNSLLFLTAIGLVWWMTSQYSGWLPTILASLFFLTSSLMIVLGQPATFAISLVTIGTILFLRNRYTPLASVMLMLSLAVKPQIGGFIVVYLALAKIHRKQAIWAMAGAVAILIVAGFVLKSRPASAHWIADLGTSIANGQAPGEAIDPRPNKREAREFANLQPMNAVFISDLETANLMSYGIVLILLGGLAAGVLKSNPSLESHYLALGALAAITMMPVYHRSYDTRLMILAIPAVTIIYHRWARSGVVTAAIAILLIVSEFIQAPIQNYFDHHGDSHGLLQNKLFLVFVMHQQPLALLALAGLCVAALFRIRFPAGAATEPEKNAMLTSFP